MTDPNIDAEIAANLSALNIPIPQQIELPMEEESGPAYYFDDYGNAIAEAGPTIFDPVSGVVIYNADGFIIGSQSNDGTALVLEANIPTIGASTINGNPKDLIGNTKPDLSLIPASASLHEASAFADGAAKYGPYNWRENAVKARVYIAAALRHINQYLDGENYDPISDVHHLGHAKACMSIILDATETGNLIDDRPLPGKAGDIVRRFSPEKKFN